MDLDRLDRQLLRLAQEDAQKRFATNVALSGVERGLTIPIPEEG